jgi:hypothetical protein
MQRQIWRAVFGTSLLAAGASVASADVVSVGASKDNTLFETVLGDRSNGIGPNIFVGRSNQMGGATLKRGVIAFDLSAIPAGSTIDSVELALYLEMAGGAAVPAPHLLHTLQQDWGEGTSLAFGGLGAPSTPGDATWIHTFWDTDNWASAGGSYSLAPSASTSVGTAAGTVTWTSTPDLVSDVQTWLDFPVLNFGWIIIGDEITLGSARKFSSRENGNPTNFPSLRITFTPPPCPADINGDGTVGFTDLTTVLSSWGVCPGCPADLDFDGIVGFTDLITVLSAWGPCP